MDWTSLWANKHDDIVVGLLVTLGAAFLCWLVSRLIRLLFSKKTDNAGHTIQQLPPQMNQQFNQVINVRPPEASQPGESPKPSLNQIDQQNIEKIRGLLSALVEQLRGEHFPIRFRWPFSSWFVFLRETAGPDHGFLDQELEQIRQSLYKTITLLQDRVARYSQGLEKDDDPERRFWMQSPPPGGNSLAELSAMDERRSEVMDIAQQTCKEYDQLVLTARRKASI